jgi:hypothetical protein
MKRTAQGLLFCVLEVALAGAQTVDLADAAGQQIRERFDEGGRAGTWLDAGDVKQSTTTTRRISCGRTSRSATCPSGSCAGPK